MQAVRIGAITARKLLDKNGYVWQTVVDAYAKKGQSEDEALMNARLAYILQKDDYDFNTKEIKLWTPTK